jgi:hypothetical protein
LVEGVKDTVAFPLLYARPVPESVADPIVGALGKVVMEFVATEGAESPAALVAITVKVYDVLLANPATFMVPEPD